MHLNDVCLSPGVKPDLDQMCLSPLSQWQPTKDCYFCSCTLKLNPSSRHMYNLQMWDLIWVQAARFHWIGCIWLGPFYYLKWDLWSKYFNQKLQFQVPFGIKLYLVNIMAEVGFWQKTKQKSTHTHKNNILLWRWVKLKTVCKRRDFFFG